MEEIVALDSKNQKKFVKSIKGIKKLIKKSKDEEPKKSIEDVVQEPPKPFSMRLKDAKVKKSVKKSTRKPVGLVYLAHIPHGFYEHQMTQYFRQFGVVTNARVIRSKRTGNSKGYAFVEFKDTAVAEVVAETMNNYLMGKRLIKAFYIPPEKQRRAFRMKWNTSTNPSSEKRLKMRKAYNANKDDAEEFKRAKKLLSNLNKTKKSLSEMGINYDFFSPVDIPESLLLKFVKQEKDDNSDVKDTKKEEIKTKKEKKASKLEEADNKNVKNKKANIKAETNKKVTKEVIEKGALKANKKDKEPVPINKQEQKDKKQKIKDAGMKPPEEFIKVNEDDSDDSDSPYEFDSDEYDKVLEDDDEDLSSGEGEGSDDDDDNEEDDDDDDDDEDDDDESEDEVPTKQVKGKPTVVPKIAQQQQSKKQAKQQALTSKKPAQEVKRKAPPQKFQGSPKKPKFEKQNQKPMKKQFKKK